MILDTVDILIIGGGIAGLATASQLAGSGHTIALVDREPMPGFYASGHNAGIARTLTGRLDHSRLAVEGRGRLAELGLLEVTGGLLMAMDPTKLKPLVEEASRLGLEALPGEGPGEPGLNATAHVRVPGDGVIDIHGLLGHCARQSREAGIGLHFGAAVTSIEADESGFTVRTDSRTFRATTLVNAAGAWATQVGRMAGGMDLRLKALRRHLAWSDHPFALRPWIWWVDRPFYARAESGGTLLCPCDEEEVSLPHEGHQPSTDPRQYEALAELTDFLIPDLTAASPVRVWSGLRTFSPDRGFVLGWDTVNPRLFWVAGLGGHGMTTGLAVGRLAAELMLSGGSTPLSPIRFA